MKEEAKGVSRSNWKEVTVYPNENVYLYVFATQSVLVSDRIKVPTLSRLVDDLKDN
jgi:hypothetical protein